MRVRFLGHSCFQIESGAGTVLLDPFLTGNPTASITADQVDCDAILLTHGHGDHLGDTVPIARRLNIPVVAVYELATWLGWQGVKAEAQHIGGQRDYPFGRVKFTLAFHGSAVADEANQQLTYTGMPAGILYTAEGKTVYHLGDTGLTREFELIGSRQAIDVALVPIGDNFTMGPDDAAEAVRMLGAKRVVPCHYNTMPVIEQDPQEFARLVGETAKVVVLAPGESVEL